MTEQKTEEKREKWLSYLAASTVVLAVFATLSTFKGGGFSTKSVLTQNQATSQWSYYQAKSIKAYLYELERAHLDLELKGLGTSAAQELQISYQKQLAAYDEKIARYNLEKEQIEKDARALEDVRDESAKHAHAFGMAVILLQIAILLCSIAGLFKHFRIWLGGLALGSLGIFCFANGWWLFVPGL